MKALIMQKIFADMKIGDMVVHREDGIDICKVQTINNDE